MEQLGYWDAVLRRDITFDGAFVYAVRTTGVYCRPSCAARRPKAENVQFFAGPAEAETAGFRPCRRCRPSGAPAAEPHVALVAQICRYLEACDEHVPTLDELASHFGVSPFHLQRVFKRVTGVSPREYASEHRASRFQAALKEGNEVTDAIYDAGFGSSSPAYEMSAGRMGMSPRRYRDGGAHVRIRYALAPCALGWLLVGATERGICAVRLADTDAELVRSLRDEYFAAELTPDRAALSATVDALLRYLDGRQPHLDLPLDVQATAFQRQVWDALRAIPYGATRSYQEVAASIGRPGAVRAVGSACAHNPAALVIPCHRVVRADGALGGYRWGLERKRALLDQEAQHAPQIVGIEGESTHATG